MTTDTNTTLQKAEAALDILLEHDEKNSDIGFKNLMDQIILAWKERSQ